MIYGNKYYKDKSSIEVVEEVSVEDFFKMIKDWKADNSNKLTWPEFKSDKVSDKDYKKLEKIFEDLKDEDHNYHKYARAFKELCKYIHVGYEGTVITKHKLEKGKESDKNKLYVQYNFNTKKFKLPEGVDLFHISKVSGIKALRPSYRGKSEKGYLYYRPRVYLTINKYMPTLAADYVGNVKLYKYKTKQHIRDVFVDPLLTNQAFGAIYVETDRPIPVIETKDNIIKDTGKAIKKTIDDTTKQKQESK